MPANTSPIFALTPNIGLAKVTAANTNSDGTGTVATDIFKAFTSGANGSWVARAIWSPVATAAGTGTAATVGRIFLSTIGSGSTTGGVNTWALGEVTLAAVTADSSSAPVNELALALSFAIPTGYFIHGTNHAAPNANTSWQLMVVGGDY